MVQVVDRASVNVDMSAGWSEDWREYRNDELLSMANWLLHTIASSDGQYDKVLGAVNVESQHDA